MQQSLLRDLERRAEQLRHKSILLRLARDEPTGYGLEFFGDDDELWDALGTPLTGCPFERRRGVVLSQAARVIEPSRAAPSSPRCAPRFARPPAGRRATLRRLAFGTLLPALACPGCSSSVEGRSSDPEQADESTTEETTGIGGFNTVTTAPSPGSFGDAGDTSDTSDTSTSTAETSADATTGSPPDVTPPVLENLRVNWSADPDPITQPGPVDVRVDATDSDTGIDRVEFSHNKDGAPFAIGTDYGSDSFGATVAIDHQKFAGVTTFRVDAYDNAGNHSSASVEVDVELLPSGYTAALTGTNHAAAGEVWSGLAVDDKGELIVVGHYMAEGELPRIVIERRSPDGDELIAADFEEPAPGEASFASAIAIDDEDLLVLVHAPDRDIVVRYGADGAIAHTRTSAGVEFRDLAVTEDSTVVVVGNTGALGVDSTTLRVWWYTPSLTLEYQRGAVGDGPNLNAAARVRVAGENVIVAGFVEQAGERGAWIGSYSAESATEQWHSVHYDGQDEVFADFTPVDGGRIVTIGTAMVDSEPRVRMRRLTLTGEQPLPSDRHDVSNLPYDAPFQYGVRVARTPGAGEFVMGARTCTLAATCQGAVRRYTWSNLGPTPLWWNDSVGLKTTTTTITDLVAGSWGYVFSLSHCLVNYGQGHHDQASLDRYSP